MSRGYLVLSRLELLARVSEESRDTRQRSDFPAQKFIHDSLAKLDVLRSDINLPPLITAGGAVTGIETGGTIKVLLELVELDIVIPGSKNRVRSKHG